MQARSLCTVVIGLASTGMLACASGSLEDGGGSFTTANDSTTNSNDTTNDLTTTNGENGESGETGHAEEESGETGDPPPPDPTCDDGQQNQDETDVDCGGATCGPCSDGQACVLDSDCDTELQRESS